MTARLAAWADRHILPVLLVLLAVTDAATGLTWTSSPVGSFRSPVYDVAQRLFSMDTYGALMLLATAVAAVAVSVVGRRWITGYLIGGVLGGMWLFWALLFFFGTWGRHGSSYLGAILAGLLLAPLHFLAGLAVAHQPSGR